MTQHTQGPWLHTNKDMHGRYQIKDYNHNFIAFTDDGNLSNARLIAAAPELLEACEYLMSVNSYWWQEANGADDMIRAAIAKAKGE